MRMHSGALLERDRFSLWPIACVCHKTPCCVTAIYCSKHQLYWGCDVMIIYVYIYYDISNSESIHIHLVLIDTKTCNVGRFNDID